MTAKISDFKKIKKEEKGLSLSSSDEHTKSVSSQLKKLFESVRKPGEVRDYSSRPSKLVGSPFEDALKDLIARGYNVYTIIGELRRRFGEKKIFRARNILGYIKSEVLNKTENLQQISDLRYQYQIDTRDTQYEIERETKSQNKELKKVKRRLIHDIEDLYARIEIMKESNRRGKFSSQTEKQITSNYQLIDDKRNQLKLIQAEEKGLIIDVEVIRAEVIKTMIGMAVQHFVPQIKESRRDMVLDSFKQDVKGWIATSTKLNEMTRMQNGSASQGLIPKRSRV